MPIISKARGRARPAQGAEQREGESERQPGAVGEVVRVGERDEQHAAEADDRCRTNVTAIPAQTHIIARMAAQIQDAAPVTSDRDDLGVSMPRRGDGSGLRDAINQMLGRR